jgi:hypothetical protein
MTAERSSPGAPPPLRVLCVLPSPRDLPRYDAERLWRDISAALEALSQQGRVIVERLGEATETALKRRLAETPWHVLYFVGHARARAAARYATLALESSDGRARNLTSDYFAALVANSPSVRMLVLQACDAESFRFEAAAEDFIERGLGAVVTAGPLDGAPLRTFLSKLCAGLLAGMAACDLDAALRAALATSGSPAAPVRWSTREPDMPVFPLRTDAAAASAGPEPAGTPAPARDAPPAPEPPAWRRELERKRLLGEFDVFLCHNGADKPAVRRIAQQLKEAGVLPWLDEWELPPGQPWQPLLEKQIGSIRTAAVFVGPAGIGPWQEQELYGFLREFVSRQAPVIPVLLPDAPSRPELPIFLRAMTWVDFRTSYPDPLDRLIWGITGRRPSD